MWSKGTEVAAEGTTCVRKDLPLGYREGYREGAT